MKAGGSCLIAVMVLSVIVCYDLKATRHPAGTADTTALVDLDGNPIDITTLANEHRAVLLTFWASWCGPCVQEFPTIETIAADFESRGLKVVLVNVGEERKVVEGFVRGHHVQSQVLLDVHG